MARRVRTNSNYYYDPVGWDRVDPPWGVTHGTLEPGDLVKVIRIYGCPPPNTMGHAHINKGTEFAGLVHTNSLIPKKEWKERS